jgi:hypothetical protein
VPGFLQRIVRVVGDHRAPAFERSAVRCAGRHPSAVPLAVFLSKTLRRCLAHREQEMAVRVALAVVRLRLVDADLGDHAAAYELARYAQGKLVVFLGRQLDGQREFQMPGELRAFVAVALVLLELDRVPQTLRRLHPFRRTFRCQYRREGHPALAPVVLTSSLRSS